MPVYVITTQNPVFSGIREGLSFINGRAETEDPQIAHKLANRPGYIVILPQGKDLSVEGQVEELITEFSPNQGPKKSKRKKSP